MDWFGSEARVEGVEGVEANGGDWVFVIFGGWGWGGGVVLGEKFTVDKQLG